MPQRKCCVSTCTSSLIEGAVLHAFPNPSTDSDKFHTWVNNAGLISEDKEHVFKKRRICHLHFEKMYHYLKNRLSRIAVPTLHLSGNEPVTQVENNLSARKHSDHTYFQPEPSSPSTKG